MTPTPVKLADPAHKLPWPGVRGRFFSPEGEIVDIDDPFWSQLINDGSIIIGLPAIVAKPASIPVQPASPAPQPGTPTPPVPVAPPTA